MTTQRSSTEFAGTFPRHSKLPGGGNYALPITAGHDRLSRNDNMNRIAFVAASAAALLIAGAASAQSKTIAINGTVAPKCGVSAQQSTVTLSGDLTDTNAKVRSAVTNEIATALNGAQIVAFCNGVNNSVEIKRAVLARVGSTGTGLTEGDYAQFIRYNLDASLNGLALDSTSTDGASVVAARFGGHDSLSSAATRIAFAQATADGAAVASSNGSTPTAVNWSSLTDRRLAAGTYTGSVEVVLTPGA